MTTDKSISKYKNVEAAPVKAFFVNMLTRDIELEDALLDLLDNCIDGILRIKHGRDGETPYKGFGAEISFGDGAFSIKDNCGGIPWQLAGYAFRMGKPEGKREKDMGTLGIYGIGMKRAIFKLGRHCKIETQHAQDRYQVSIQRSWFQDDDDWQLPVTELGCELLEDGTKIEVDALTDEATALLDENTAAFSTSFTQRIARQYAFIIGKGFEVYVNGVPVKPMPTMLVFSDTEQVDGIRPFFYRTNIDDVEVFLAVGFTRPIPSRDEAEDEQEELKYSSLGAGWTVVCNDRVVLYSDRTELTGWGEAGVPRYHNQFIAISGIVEFWSKDALKLPTTTTKRGINSSSRLYLQVKNKMREGMQLFTSYTNRWKGKADEAKSHLSRASVLTMPELKKKSEELQFSTVKRGLGGSQYKPRLPVPEKKEEETRRISFVRQVNEIERVASYLFDEVSIEPSEVGGRCFDEILSEARK